MSGARILVVEDDEDSRDALVALLTYAAYDATSAPTAEAAEAAVLSERPDLIVLDLRLPGRDGYDVLARLREVTDIPVIILSGLVSPTDKARGLRLGADDYVGKPWDAIELLARIEARLRPARTRRIIEAGRLTIDVGRREVRIGDTVVSLTNRQFDVLALLASDPGRVFRREDILHEVWGTVYVTTRNVNEQVRLLRDRLEQCGAAPDLIETVPGLGYRLSSNALTSP